MTSYKQGLIMMTHLPSLEIHKYYQYLIVIYNNLGLSYLNQD